jgi:diguanylate cyclase
MAKEETPLLKAIEKMLDDYLESGFFSVGSFPESSKYEKKIKEKLEQVSERIRSERLNDPLTNTWSRQLFTRLMDSALATSNLDSRSYCLAYFDIDKMKHINDYYGIPNGEATLVRVADTLKSNFHPTHWICRVGGDEFVGLLHCDLGKAEELIKKLQESLKDLVIIDDKPEVRITLKIGLTALRNSDKIDTCMRRLDNSIHNIRNQLVIV